MNDLGKFSLSTEEVCEPLKNLTSSKGQWPRRTPIKAFIVRAKITTKTQLQHSAVIKEQLYLETDALGIGLGVRLLQVRDGM